MIPLFSWLARGLLGRLLPLIITRYAAPPASGLRSQAPFNIYVMLQHKQHQLALTLSGHGVYELTAEIVAYAASQILKMADRPSGVLAPSAVLEPESLLEYASQNWGVLQTRSYDTESD
jgi:hypothetical protein